MVTFHGCASLSPKTTKGSSSYNGRGKKSDGLVGCFSSQWKRLFYIEDEVRQEGLTYRIESSFAEYLPGN